MKKVVTAFPRQTYLTGTGGVIKTYVHDVSLISQLGQGKHLLIRVVGHRRSTNARCTLRVFETSHPELRPTEAGTQLGTAQAFTALRQDPFTISSPFEGRIEISMDIDASAGAAVEEFDLEVVVTVIVDE